MARVELRGVSKAYPGRVEAVIGVDLDVADGEYLTIVGPSGSGKSTLLRLVAGLEAPDAGTIAIGDRPAERLAPEARDVAMVFQDQVPYPHLDVFENLAFGLRARGRPSAEVSARVEEVAGLLGLSSVLRRAPAALSGGQRRRVALGRALARRPAILLLDEPLSALDAPLRASTRADLAELHRRLGTTTLHVTHDQAEALALGDRVAMVDGGRLVQVGTPRAVYDRPATRAVAEFLGSPPMNLARAEVRVEESRLLVRLPGGGPGAEAWLPRSAPSAASLGNRGDGPIDLGVRPEHIQLVPDPPDGPAGTRLAIMAAVRRIEPQGHETLVALGSEAGPFVVRVAPTAGWAVGSAAALVLDLAAACWFDPATGRALA